MKTALISAAAFALMSAPALAEQWGLIKNDPADAMAVNLGSRQHEGNTASQWIIALYPTSRDFGGKTADYIMTHEQYRCAERQRRSVYVVFYNKSGSATYTAGTGNHPWMDIPPDSTGTNAIDAACGLSSPPIVPQTDAVDLLKQFRSGNLR